VINIVVTTANRLHENPIQLTDLAGPYPRTSVNMSPKTYGIGKTSIPAGRMSGPAENNFTAIMSEITNHVTKRDAIAGSHF
jgi:hypothetical protein